jgi:uncharacterized protein with ATP-grasp and redox domains
LQIDNECVECIINQSVRVANLITDDESLKNKIISSTKLLSKDFSFNNTPPEIASYVYENMADIAKKYDLYDEVKQNSTKKALSFVPLLKEKLLDSNDKFLTAIKIAVAGNVIDLAAQVEFDLDEELNKIFHTNFAYDDVDILKQELEKSKTVLLIGDNVGEHIFDYMFIEVLQDFYPKIKFSYMVLGNPIINDVTIKEAKEAKFDELCELVDSGVNTPGFAYNRANKYSQVLFDSVDIVLSKGMGNYECLSESHRKNICFLLKVKCNVVANALGKNLGDIVCKLN